MIDVFKIKEGKLFVATICGTNRYEDDEDDRVNNILVGIFEADSADSVNDFIIKNALNFEKLKKSHKYKNTFLHLPNYTYGDVVIKEIINS